MYREYPYIILIPTDVQYYGSHFIEGKWLIYTCIYMYHNNSRSDVHSFDMVMRLSECTRGCDRRCAQCSYCTVVYYVQCIAWYSACDRLLSMVHISLHFHPFLFVQCSKMKLISEWY